MDFTTGAIPIGVAMGDIDGDGKPDLAVANQSSNTVSVFRDTSTSGSVSFAAKVDFTTGAHPLIVAISDIDGDGKPDLAVTNNGSDTVSVFRNASPAGAVCGNGILQSGEQCDDGNASSGDCCSSSCQFEAVGAACASDGNICTRDVCNASGVCTHPAGNDGSPCSDGNACTTGDVCTNGTCGGIAVTCTALDQCHDAGTCDPATGSCSNPAKPNGAACSDGNACTQTDTCQAGTCSGSNPKICAALDQCHVAGTCDPGTGACSNPVAADGTACDDGNASTVNDTCTGGVCVGTLVGPAIVPFATFDAKVEIEDEGFEVKATFTLGTGSDGIDPLTEEVSFQVGTFSTTIPTGSFKFKPAQPGKKGKPGKPAEYKFEGVINGVFLEAKITPLGANTFEFKAEGEGVDLTGTVNPVDVELAIGDDSGSTTVPAEFGGEEED